ncbi:MAG: FixH family protein [Polyangiaceae bacterium]|jgi:hypothetical protein
MRIGWIAGWLALSVACGTASTPETVGFTAPPMLALVSRDSAFQIAVRTSPQPPTRGEQSVEYAISSATTGAPASGLTLVVVPWMPAMGHGTAVTPVVSETIPGTYLLANVDFFMPGQWVLRTTISGPPGSDAAADGGSPSDYVEPSFEIP